jgi:hypothetical protein
LKFAEDKLEVVVEEEKEAFSALQAACFKHEDGRKAHRVLQEHFLLKKWIRGCKLRQAIYSSDTSWDVLKEVPCGVVS